MLLLITWKCSFIKAIAKIVWKFEIIQLCVRHLLLVKLTFQNLWTKKSETNNSSSCCQPHFDKYLDPQIRALVKQGSHINLVECSRLHSARAPLFYMCYTAPGSSDPTKKFVCSDATGRKYRQLAMYHSNSQQQIDYTTSLLNNGQQCVKLHNE